MGDKKSGGFFIESSCNPSIFTRVTQSDEVDTELSRRGKRSQGVA
ncbi:MAG TPA: hypothetical protein VJI66_01725 [Candidatus Paceibacterota bacterium]